MGLNKERNECEQKHLMSVLLVFLQLKTPRGAVVLSLRCPIVFIHVENSRHVVIVSKLI